MSSTVLYSNLGSSYPHKEIGCQHILWRLFQRTLGMLMSDLGPQWMNLMLQCNLLCNKLYQMLK